MDQKTGKKTKKNDEGEEAKKTRHLHPYTKREFSNPCSSIGSGQQT
jgi:hypothetical protein